VAQYIRNYQIGLIMTGTAVTFALLIICNFLLPFAYGLYIFIPFGAVFIFPFIASVAYAIIRYHLFNVRVITTEIFAFVLTIVTLLQIVFSHSALEVIFRIGIFILVLVVAIVLIRSVLNEVQQREKIQVLADQLGKANDEQVILIHFITHQLKGFVTKSRNIFSMLIEGDYGVLPDTMKELVAEGFRSDTKGAQTIQEILNAANIKSGKVTYDLKAFDLKALVEEILNDLKPAADAKNLTLTLSAGSEPVEYVGDRAQLTNSFKNLIDNSIKYTPAGKVEVSLTKNATLIHFEIKDTGVGITKEDMTKLFTEGGHGAESQKVNVDSTGFGLYIVKNIIVGHGGKVWAESEGAGKGSRFIVELPIKQPPEAATSAP
jgi:signal transduction histidine kinase